jgi:hypothetical protein
MKWALVVYFFVMTPTDTGYEGRWGTAEELERVGWHRTYYATAEECIQAQWEFTENQPKIDQMRASCEIDEY